MSSWQSFAEEAPELATAVRARFTAAKHHVLATVRGDGSPRVSGTEVGFQGPDIVVGSMLGAVKALDLRRDGRFALHANPGDGSMTGGDAKLSGRAVEVTDASQSPDPSTPHDPAASHLFRLDLAEAVLTAIHPDGDRLLIRFWRPDRGIRDIERR